MHPAHWMTSIFTSRPVRYNVHVYMPVCSQGSCESLNIHCIWTWCIILCLNGSALVEDKGSEYRGQIRALQERVRELEAVQQTHLTTSTRTVHTLSSERGMCTCTLYVCVHACTCTCTWRLWCLSLTEVSEQLERELRETREAYHLLQGQHQQLKNRAQYQVTGNTMCVCNSMSARRSNKEISQPQQRGVSARL